MNAPPNPSNAIRHRRLAGAVLVMAILIVHANSLHGVFLFDDFPAIRDNPTLRSLWPLTGPLSPPQNSGVGGRPLSNLSLAVNYALRGPDARGYHWGNIALHACTALLLFGLVRRTMRLRSGSAAAPIQSGHALWPAFALALLWALHPLTTASVSYLSQRTEVLMGSCYLATLYAFARSLSSSRPGTWRALSVAACALGMMAKEVMVTAPLLTLCYDRTFAAGSFRRAALARKGYYAALGATWLLLGYLMLTSRPGERSVGFGLGVSALQYALTEATAVLTYVKLAFWPAPLVFDYGAAYVSPNPASIAVAGVVVATAAWSFRRFWRGSAVGFAAVAFFLLLAPTSSVVPVAEQPIAENRMYLPLAAGLGLAGVGLSSWAGRRGGWAIGGVAVALALTTAARNTVYHDETAMWMDTARKRPANSRAHYNGAITLVDAGRVAEAVPYFQRSLALKPDEAKAHNSLGSALLELGRPDDALAHFNAALQLQPIYPRASYNAGLASLRQGDTQAALAHLTRAVQLEPASAASRAALGNAYFQSNQPARALEHYVIAIRSNPQLADAHYNSGSACLELGRYAEAAEHFAAAARLKPDDAEVQNNLGAALLQAGRVPEAIAAFAHALRLKPDYQDARDNLEQATRAARR